MPVEPISAIVMEKYRNAMNVNGAPSFIDSSIPPQPVAIIADGTAQVAAKLGASTKDISGAVAVTFFTVPTNKRWRVKLIQRDSTTAATEVQVSEALGMNSVKVTPYTTSGSNTIMDILLDQGTVIRMLGTSNVGDASRSMSIIYEEQDIR